jgi:SAM-dependent methyltransferase
VLDLCCGHGRHAVELAGRGYRVTGLDLSPERLAMARERAARASVNVEWVEADMRRIPPAGYDAVFVLYCSFGFLEDDAAHLEALRSIREALVPGGSVLLQTDNRDHAIHQPPRQWGEVGPLLWWEEDRFDPRTSRNHLHYMGLHRETGQRYEQSIHYRLFSVHELEGLLQAAGLRVEGRWGGLDGRPLELNSPELVLWARRPG